MTKPYTMRGEHHIEQFPNAGNYLHNEDYTRQMWWDMPESEKPQGYASGGSVISQLRKRGTGEKTELGQPKTDFGSHPAHKIPGIHIVTAEAGEPVFTGER
jgi:hypothetical protein